jgi:hypothetical protein
MNAHEQYTAFLAHYHEHVQGCYLHTLIRAMCNIYSLDVKNYWQVVSRTINSMSHFPLVSKFRMCEFLLSFPLFLYKETTFWPIYLFYYFIYFFNFSTFIYLSR